jgi:hypothetical protein
MDRVQSEAHQPDSGDTSLKGLRERRAELSTRRSRVQNVYRLFLGMAIVVMIVAPVSASSFLLRPHATPSEKQLIVTAAAAYIILPWAMLPSYRQRLRDADTDIQELDFQIDLQQFQVSNIESRAEKILRINDFQLRRYYDLNLSQNLWVFGLGIFCIILGVLVIASSLYLVLHVAVTPQAQIVTAILGGTGALFTNIIAAIYLKMNTSASDNLAAFHAKLVQTNRLLLANLLVSRIEDAEKRGTVLATLAVGLVGSPPEGVPPPH